MYEKNSLYNIEHNNSQLLRVINQPLLKKFRAGPSMSRMGMGMGPGFVGDGATLNQSAISGLSLTNLNLTKQGTNIALNRDLIQRAYPGLLKKTDNSYLNLSLAPSLVNPHHLDSPGLRD